MKQQVVGQSVPASVGTVPPSCSSGDRESRLEGCGAAPPNSWGSPTPPVAAPLWVAPPASPASAPDTSPSPASAPPAPVAPVAAVPEGEGAEGREVAASWVTFLRMSFLRWGFVAVSPPVAAVAAADAAPRPPSAHSQTVRRLGASRSFEFCYLLLKNTN